MLVKILGRYLLGPAATIGVLASFGVFDRFSPAPVPADAGPAERVLAALSGPLAVAERIAVAGGAELGFSPAEVSGLFDVARVDFGVRGGSAGPSVSISRNTQGAKTVRPPEPETR